MLFAVISTVVPNVLGLAIAVLLDRTGWVFNALRAAFFVPVVLSFVVVSVVWSLILTDDGLLFMGFVRTIPIELEQAAEIDGAGPLRIFWWIVFPLMKPATASVLIFVAVAFWNDFITPLIVLGPSSGTTVTVGIYRSVSQYSSNYGAVFAFMVLATIPILVLFLFFQRYFVKGLVGGATKG